MSKPIVSKRFDGVLCHLCNEKTGVVINEGTKLLNFRGEPAKIEGGRAPHKPGSQGFVWCNGGEFYPSVYDLIWKPVENSVGQPRKLSFRQERDDVGGGFGRADY